MTVVFRKNMSTAFIFNKSLQASGLIEMYHFNYANSKYSSNSKYGTYIL